MVPTTNLILISKKGDLYIISTLQNRKDTLIILIEGVTGTIIYNGIQNHDIFPSEEKAYEYLSSYLEFKYEKRACEIIGLLKSGSSIHLVIATELIETAIIGENIINTIHKSEWIELKLSYPLPKHSLEEMRTYPLDNLHFMCRTLDLTRSFPSYVNNLSYDHQFCWNHELAKPFKQIGLREICCVLIQGVAIGFENSFLIAKKTSLNPGTRYHARGLNKLSGSGNEVECEYIMISGTKWKSYTWRRGTVPVRWTNKLRSSLSPYPEITIKPNPLAYTPKYFQRLKKKYEKEWNIVEPSIVCVSLLKEKHREADLNSIYSDAAEELGIHLIKYDWHDMIKQNGLNTTVLELWLKLRDSMVQMGFSEGKISPKLQVEYRQKGIIRWNCADSLDRTNVASFFLIHPILQIMTTEHNWTPFMKLTNQSKIEKIQKMIPSQLLSSLARYFIILGDAMSHLYTHSPALFTNLYRKYAPELNSTAPSGFLVSLRRRYQNVRHDPGLHQIYKIFSGRSRIGLFNPPPILLSVFPSFVNEPYKNPKETFSNFGELFIHLRTPSIITEISFRLLEPFPAYLDVFIGENENILFPVISRLKVPECFDITPIHYEITPIQGRIIRLCFGQRSTVSDICIYGLEKSKSPIEAIKVINENISERKINDLSSRYGLLSSTSIKTISTDLSRSWNSESCKFEIEILDNYLYQFENDIRELENDNPNLNSELEEYWKFVELNPQPSNYKESLIIDSKRVHLGVGIFERDKILYERGRNPIDYDPEIWVYPRDVRLHAQSIGKQIICSNCSSMEISSTCYYCFKNFCSDCINPEKMRIIEYMLKTPVSVCISCSKIIEAHENLQTSMYISTPLEEFDSMLSLTSHSDIISEYPYAYFLNKIPLEEGSESLKSLLYPLSIQSYRGWYSLKKEIKLKLKLIIESKIKGILLIAGDKSVNFKIIINNILNKKIRLKPYEKFKLKLSKILITHEIEICLISSLSIIQLSRLHLLGKRIIKNERINKILDSGIPKKINKIRPIFYDFNVYTNVLQIGCNGKIKGISYTVTSISPDKQTKEISISVFGSESFRFGKIVIPKAIKGQKLIYWFGRTIHANVVVIHMISNYGGTEFIPGLVHLIQ